MFLNFNGSNLKMVFMSENLYGLTCMLIYYNVCVNYTHVILSSFGIVIVNFEAGVIFSDVHESLESNYIFIFLIKPQKFFEMI